MEVPGLTWKSWPPRPPPTRARLRATLPPTPRSQRRDRGVGGSLEAWSNWRGVGWPVGRRVRREIGRSVEGEDREELRESAVMREGKEEAREKEEETEARRRSCVSQGGTR